MKVKANAGFKTSDGEVVVSFVVPLVDRFKMLFSPYLRVRVNVRSGMFPEQYELMDGSNNELRN
jgi:hypothetical protein